MAQEPGSLKVEPGASLRILALAAIRTEIAEGRMAPGMRLVERDLGAALGVSRTVVREVIRQLEVEGYVTQVPRRGPIVAPLDLDTIRSIYEVREALEAKAAALFVERATEVDRAAIAEITARLVAYPEDAPHVPGLAILDELHRAIIRGSGNLMLEAMLAPLTGRVHILRVQAVMSPERRAAATRQLAALAEALCGCDPEAAAAAARARLADAAKFAAETWRKTHPD